MVLPRGIGKNASVWWNCYTAPAPSPQKCGDGSSKVRNEIIGRLMDCSITGMVVVTTSFHQRRIYQNGFTVRLGWSTEHRRLFQPARNGPKTPQQTAPCIPRCIPTTSCPLPAFEISPVNEGRAAWINSSGPENIRPGMPLTGLRDRDDEGHKFKCE